MISNKEIYNNKNIDLNTPYKISRKLNKNFQVFEKYIFWMINEIM